MGAFENKLTQQMAAKRDKEKLQKIALKEFGTVENLTNGIRHLEIFSQLMRLKAFVEWMKDHIELHTQIDGKTQQISTLVMVKNVETSEDQHIVQCPGCGVSFDANAKTSSIVLANEMPK
jgi:hypothetical protein